MQRTSARLYALVSAAIFGAVALMHLSRVAFDWPFVIGPLSLPVWLSGGGLIAATVLCIWGLRVFAARQD